MTQSADPAEVQEEKRVSWAELFFDLVFVFAITEVSVRLAKDHSGAGLLRAFVAFVPVYWVWVGTTLQANLRDAARPALRIEMFAAALAGLFMALAIPYAFEDRRLLFACAYLGARLVLGVPLLRRVRTWNPYTVSMFVTGPALVVGALLPEHAQLAVWACAALLDLATPTIFRRRLSALHYDAAHLSERFGLFVVIALGESVVAIGSAAQHHIDVPIGFAVGAAFVLSCGLWWVYFQFAADAVRHALATARVQLDITRLVLSYGHLFFIASIIALAVGMKAAVAAPRDPLHWPYAAFLCGGTALYLATFGFTRWAMFRLVSTTRLTASAAALAVLPAAAYEPGLAALFEVGAVLVVLNIVEWMRVERIGWRAKLARRAPG